MKFNKYVKLVVVFSMVLLFGMVYILVVFEVEGDVLIVDGYYEEEDALDIEANEDTHSIEEDDLFNYVFVSGAIKNPGVYEVEDNTRVFTVIKLAGGLEEDADINAVNQAEPVMDGQHIYFPTVKEVEEGYSVEASQSNFLININTATLEQLATLPSIGEVKARSIIDYRTSQGKFQSTEEIMNIDGIKDGIYNRIKEFITI
ncbi:competence protein ComEA [Natranaerovirga hydrolytica]|uniref:Competence protein ComEA n=1 Tax=Natranaerovirga hydrolytica TaxID=680378 RepID=A0A4R1N0L3_9FIRM|nr:helix-hairpin-helix domain-containing protein [Natranaerovirga hydrolytica]TCK98412.1 competence protein ComEA [Natranaerovirga hydrolytica]